MTKKIFSIEVYQHEKGKWDWDMHSSLTGTHHGFCDYPSCEAAENAAVSYCEWAYYSYTGRPRKNFDINAECDIKKIKGISKRGVTVTIVKEQP